MRAELGRRDGELIATPFDKQDSSMLSHFARAGCLVIRPPDAAPARAGDRVEIVPLGHSSEGI